MSRENVEVVRRLHEMFSRREGEAAFAFYDPDIRWDLSQMELFDAETVYRGHEGVRAFWRWWLSAWSDIEFELQDIRAVGDRVVTRLLQRNRGRESGVWTPPYEWAAIWTFRDGKIVSVEMFLNPAEALEAAGLTE